MATSVTNMKELCEYAKKSVDLAKLSTQKSLKSMVSVKVWVTNVTNYLKNPHFHNNISTLVIKCGEEIMKNMI